MLRSKLFLFNAKLALTQTGYKSYYTTKLFIQKNKIEEKIKHEFNLQKAKKTTFSHKENR